MLTVERNAQLFHQGILGPTAYETFSIESNVESLLASCTRYPISISTLDSLYHESQVALKRLPLQKDSSFNPNSNKDVAAKLDSLHLGVSIPKTEKGNISLTKEWLDLNKHKHSFIDLVGQWRLFNRSLQTVDSLRKHIFSDVGSWTKWLPTKWRTYSENGSGRIVAEAYPINQIPVNLRQAFPAPVGFVWVSCKYPLLDLHFLAALSKDPLLIQDLTSSDPMASLAVKLKQGSPEQAKTFLDTFIYDFTPDVYYSRVLESAYPDLANFLNKTLLDSSSSKMLSLGWMDRIRNFALDPEVIDSSSLRKKTLSSICTQNLSFYIKNCIDVLLRSFPELGQSYWIPGQNSLAFTCPEGLLGDVTKLLQIPIKSIVAPTCIVSTNTVWE